MAFLRSVARCNSFVSKKLSNGSCSGGSVVGGLAKWSRSDLLASHRYYIELRRELNSRCNASTVAAHPTSISNAAPSNPSQSPKDPLDVSFNDPSAAFKSKTTFELLRAYVVYLMCSSEYLVENNLKVTSAEIQGPSALGSSSNVVF